MESIPEFLSSDIRASNTATCMTWRCTSVIASDPSWATKVRTCSGVNSIETTCGQSGGPKASCRTGGWVNNKFSLETCSIVHGKPESTK